MRSTFMGLETARRGMFTQQGALYVTGHNIANANTPGFSRQRLNFEQTNPYPSVSIDRPQIPGQMGTGVQAGSVQRIREGFLDYQYREENRSFGYWNARSEALSKMEDIINEPSDEGLANVMNQFWTSLSDLSVHPEDPGARSVVRQRGKAVSETFNYLSNRLTAIRDDLGKHIDNAVLEVNSLLKQLNGINNQIGEVEPHGYLPNDLYDQRDQLVDRLSELINIKVTSAPSGGNALAIAEGKYTIQMIDQNGQPLGTLVDGRNLFINELSVKKNSDGFVEKIGIGADPHKTEHDFSKINGDSNGKLSSLIRSYGYMDGTDKKGDYPEKIDQLDLMAYKFVKKFNEVHNAGWSITEIRAGQKEGKDFFAYSSALSITTGQEHIGAAKFLKVAADIDESLDNIAAASTAFSMSVNGDFSFTNHPNAVKMDLITTAGSPPSYNIKVYYKNGTNSGVLSTNNTDLNISLPSNISSGTWTVEIPTDGKIRNVFVGDGSNAQALADVKDAKLQFQTDYETNVMSFYQGIIGDMGTDAADATRRFANSETLLGSIQQNRDSVSSVSLDEEMSNMVKFQHAYNASARMITAVDEILDKIINGMGVVGR